MDARDARCRHPAPLLQALLDQELRRTVHRDALELRKPGLGRLADGHELLGGQNSRVAVGQEDGPNPVRAVLLEGDVEVFDELFQRPHPEPAPLVHATERALVMRTPERGLEDERSSFTRGSIHHAFVTHARLPRPAPSRSTGRISIRLRSDRSCTDAPARSRARSFPLLNRWFTSAAGARRTRTGSPRSRRRLATLPVRPSARAGHAP